MKEDEQSKTRGQTVATGGARQRTILITGCSSGIGLDAALGLTRAGWRVIATCRQQADADRLADNQLETLMLDYADSESVQAAAVRALQMTDGKLDVLFNNGAYAIPGLVEDLPRDALRAIFETNVFGPFELINALLPGMRQAGAGCIVNCSSVLGFAALPFRGAYNATKFAMEGLTDTLRLELRGSPIHVVLIEPGPITSKIRQNSIRHFERWIDVESSTQTQRYQEQLIPRLYRDKKPDRFELPASAVTDCLLGIIEQDNPKPRYYLTKPTHVAGALKRVLSTRAFDWVLSR